jgi:hypothetical protein
MKLSAIAVDPALIEQGDWIDDLPDMPGIRIKARGTGNSDYRKLEARLIRQIPREQRMHGLKPKDHDRIIGQLLLETVVLDVEGLEEEGPEEAGADAERGSTPIKYTRELGEKLLLDPEFVRFRNAAAYAGEVVAQRRKTAAKDDAKN